MDGKQIFENLSKRDFTGSEQDLYAQTLQTIFFHCYVNGDADIFFELLKNAENEKKRLDIPDKLDEYNFSDIIIK